MAVVPIVDVAINRARMNNERLEPDAQPQSRHPFLENEESVEFLRAHGRVMFITRGLPGSGKAGVAETVKDIYPDCKIICADQLFSGFGAVDKNWATTVQAHTLCQARTEEALRGKIPMVLNRNNNATIRETSRYVQLAAKYGYLVIIVNTLQKELMTAEYLAACNTKLLDTTYFERALKAWEDVDPLCTGWFFKPCDKATLLRHLKHLQKECAAKGLQRSEVHATPEPCFCLARYCWFGVETTNKEYCDKVTNAFGTVHLLRVCGYVIVQGTAFGLVKLDAAQRKEFADGRAIKFLGTARWKQTFCVEATATVLPQAEEEELACDAPKSTWASKPSDPMNFVVLGSTDRAFEASSAARPDMDEIWQRVARDTWHLPSTRVGDAVVREAGGARLILLDRAVSFKTMFAGFYQPYVSKYKRCLYFASENGCKRGDTCNYDHY